MELKGKAHARFRRKLLAWYARHKRAMPWRGTRDAYRVWVSEVMLQQTRVAAVEPYYRRFVRRFPTLRALARARSEEVLKLWAGLGYYSRARNLHRAAKEIIAKHGGKFPREAETALALPGVGRYTAAAVLSIAYGEPLAVVDGNVARVLARLGAVRGDVRETGRWRKLEERAQELMGEKEHEESEIKNCRFQIAGGRADQIENEKTTDDARSDLRAEKRRLRAALHTGPGEWNQAMMELGATVCTPRAPRCEECPVARWCKARKMGLAEKIPAARKKRAAVRVEIAAAVLVDPRGRTLLVKPEKAETDGWSPEKAATNKLFSGMWQFPAVEVSDDAVAELARHLRALSGGRKSKDLTQRAQRAKENAEKNGDGRNWVELAGVRHSVTYRELTLRPYLVRVRALPAMKGARAVPLARVGEIAVSSATKKIARIAERSVAS